MKFFHVMHRILLSINVYNIFFFKDRHNTWFLNSSSSNYIPFVKSAREIFVKKFNGSNMSSPDQHNTEWILDNLKNRCLNIYKQHNQEINPTKNCLLQDN
jgi:hypothetical protein